MKQLVFITVFTIIIGNLLYGQNNSNEMYVITGDGLNIRQAPSTSSQRIKTLPFGTKVNVLSISENQVNIDNISSYWFQIQAGNDIGWVFGGYLAYISSQHTMLIGDWQTETNFFRFYADGKYRGGRKHSSLLTSGNWFLSNDNKLYLSGLAGDDSGETIRYTDIYNIILNNNVLRLTELGRDYLKGQLSYDETGLPPL
jgi:hypothetical protein